MVGVLVLMVLKVVNGCYGIVDVMVCCVFDVV